MAQRAVYKSTAAESLDDLFGVDGGTLVDRYNRCLAALSNTGGRLADAAAQIVTDGLPEATVEAWRQQSQAGWRAPTDVDEVIRAGYVQAITLAGQSDPPLPIDNLWVTGATDVFEVHVCAGQRRVTVLMFIPLARDYGSTNANARSFVFQAGAAASDAETVVISEQVSGPR